MYSFCLQDMGTVVMGKVESGAIMKGASLLLMPNRVSRNLITHTHRTLYPYVCLPYPYVCMFASVTVPVCMYVCIFA